MRLLSYNLQVGIETHGYGDYLRQSWRHLLPDSKRQIHLNHLASWLKDYDIVALQEVDVGSLRSQYINQVEFLAKQGGFPHYYQQQNRQLAGVAAHANGILSKMASSHSIEHKLPGKLPGRGALQVSYQIAGKEVLVLSVHLALGKRARNQQLRYLAETVQDHEHFVIMGDMNCTGQQAECELMKYGLNVHRAVEHLLTFPRWQPKYSFDQIWVSQGLKVVARKSPNFGVSDHRPISIEIEIPSKMNAPQEFH